VALQQTTRELWAQQGPFEQYTIHGVPQQNIPEIYIKGAVWNAQADPPRYVAQSSAPEESGTGTWFPVDFNEEHVCWVEVRLQEPAGSEPIGKRSESQDKIWDWTLPKETSKPIFKLPR
jgi:hypothetical protein